MDRHGLRPRDDEEEATSDYESGAASDDDRLSLRGAKRRGNPCIPEVMDRHGLTASR